MQIVRIKVGNYRCIKKLNFIPSNHNILIGGVNARKSTLLTALSVVFDPDVTEKIFKGEFTAEPSIHQLEHGC